MKYCSNCGKEVNGETNFCPSCGKELTSSNNNSNSVTSSNYNKFQEKNIVTCILLSIFTLGIYGIIWFIGLVNDTNRVCNDEQSSQSGGMVFLLTLVTCGIYGIIWFYNAGKRLEKSGKKYGKEISDNSVIYLIVNLVGFGIIAYCMVQSDLNKFSA